MIKKLIILILIAGALVLAYLKMPTIKVHALWPSLVLVVFIIIMVLGVLRMQMSLFVENICFIPNNNKPLVALTFDDGPDEETERLLDILDQYQVKATFFVIGKQAEKYPAIVQRIATSGHTIGSHTYSHNWKYTLASNKKVLTEVSKGIESIRQITGKAPEFFRPPFGVTNPAIGKAIRTKELKSIGWNIRTFDTMKNSGQEILQKIRDQIKPGSIILMHDRLKITVDIMPQILDEIKKQGLTPISLDEALNSTQHD